MSTVTDKAANVASLDGQRKAKKRLTRAQSLMQRCRAQLREHMTAAIPGIMDQVDDALFDLANKAETNQLQSVYFEAMRSVRLSRDGIEARFLSELDTAIDHRLKRGDAESTHGLPKPGAESFTLVDQDELEEDLAARNIAGKIRNVCHEDLFALDRRVALLLGSPNLEGEENPLGPDVLGAAALGAVSVIEAALEIRLLVLKLFDRHLCRAGEHFYCEINDWLVREGVLPDVRAGARSAALRREETRRRASPREDETQPAAPPPGIVVPGGPRREQMLGVLDQVMRIGGGDFGDGADAAPERARFIGDLTSMQRTAAATGAVDGNVIRELRANGAASGVSHSDGLMIDVVAMMFDYILQDENVGDAMRVLIGRLQIPVLKVAILDKSFFARRTHPARVFINNLAEYGAGEGGDTGTVFDRVRSLVERILDEFDTEVDVFAGALEELEALLGEDEQAVERNAWASAKVAQERERLAGARKRAEQEVEERLAIETGPACVAEFLRAHWRNLMAERLFRTGEDSEEWQAAIVTMDRLLWSVRAKPEREDRDRLLALLPFLLEQLKLGMHEIGLSAETRAPFLRTLSELHVAAMRDPAGDVEPPARSAAAETIDEACEPAGGDAGVEATEQVAGESTSQVLREAVERANALVWKTAEDRPQCQGMGATVVAVKLEGDHLACVHAGDSRLYRLRGGALEQLSRDHTYRQEVLDRGMKSQAEAAEIASNLITRAVGGDATINAEVNVHDTAAGDLFLLCSDGLSDMLDDGAMQALMLQGDPAADLEGLAATLIDAANAAGGKDNISVGLLRVDSALPGVADDGPGDYSAFVSVHAATDAGRRRAHNEDAIDADASGGCVVLADGMGGHNAGEVASAMTVNLLMETLHAVEDAPAVGAVATGGAGGPGFDFGAINAEFWGEEGDDAGNTALYEAVADEVESIVLATHDDLDCFNIDGPESPDELSENAKRDPLLARVLELSAGTWVEFGEMSGRGQRARLSWTSPDRTRFLFTDRFGQKVCEATAYGLALELRGGRLRVLNVVPLFDRVVNRVSRSLRPQDEEQREDVA